MIFGQDRLELRRMYADAWRKAQAGDLLSPLEAQIVKVIEEHPEYRSALVDNAIDQDFTPERGRVNPFLHMGLHLALRDQVATDRPRGISRIYKGLVTKSSDAHAVEHRMIDCLAETLWEAQNRNAPPDEQAYLERLRRIAASGA